MTRSFLSPCLAAALVLTFGAAGALHAHGRDPHARVAAQNGWLTSLSAAKKEAARSGKPIMAVLRCFD